MAEFEPETTPGGNPPEDSEIDGRAGIEQRVEALLTSDLASAGYQLLDVEYRFQGRWRLRLSIERGDAGVSLDDCAAVSELAGRLLDVEDPIPQAFSMEVSSPGIFRPLKNLKHYRQSIGKQVRLNLKKSTLPGLTANRVQGVLRDADAQNLHLVQDESVLQVPLELITSARLDPDL